MKRQLIQIATHILVTTATAIAVDVIREEFHKARFEYSSQKSSPIGFVPNK